MSILNIKDPEAHILASELARQTGNSLTQVVKDALREKLAREQTTKPDQLRLVSRILEIAHRAASRPVLDSRTPDEIIGYDEFGIPS